MIYYSVLLLTSLHTVIFHLAWIIICLGVEDKAASSIHSSTTYYHLYCWRSMFYHLIGSGLCLNIIGLNSHLNQKRTSSMSNAFQSQIHLIDHHLPSNPFHFDWRFPSLTIIILLKQIFLNNSRFVVIILWIVICVHYKNDLLTFYSVFTPCFYLLCWRRSLICD